MLGFGDCPAELFVRTAVSCIESVITCHFEMFFGYVLDKQGNKVHYGKRFFHIGIVFVFIIVEGHVFSIIGINAGSGNNGTTEVTADVFYNRVSVTEIWLCIDIKTVFIFFVNTSLRFFERRTNTLFQLIQKSSLKSLAKIGIVKVLNNPPEAVIREPTLSKETMDVRIPFQRSAEGMQDTDETGDKVSAFIHFMEHSENDAAHSLKKAVKQGTVIEKERTQVFINGKNEVPVSTVNEFEGHFRRAVNAVFIAAGRAKFRVTAERNEFQFAAVGAAIHGAAVRRVSTVDHFLNIFHNNGTGMEDIFNFFVVLFKNLLKDVHKSIMREFRAESNPNPSRLRGRGVE